jgi:hypothetical protein
MRLLNVKSYKVEKVKKRVEYAILSHRWHDSEITFQNINDDITTAQLKDDQEQSPQWTKIRGACAQAEKDGWEWIWADSCCIDRSSSQELNQSINSMFKWYREARVCYVHLWDTVKPTTPGADLFEWQRTDNVSPENTYVGKYAEWFTRGWTLQELIAPAAVEFYDTNWTYMGTRAGLATPISRITGIDRQYLAGKDTFKTATVATRLSWQAGRVTLEDEDIAYSLVGLMEVELPTMYTEGKQAFQRLQEEILKNNPDESIFAWTIPPGKSLPTHSRRWASDQWGLLAPTPECFANSRDITTNGPGYLKRAFGSIQKNPGGVKFPVPYKERNPASMRNSLISLALVLTFVGIIPVIGYNVHKDRHRNEIRVTLNCWRRDRDGRLKAVRIFLARDKQGDQVWRRGRCARLELADKLPKPTQPVDLLVLQPEDINWPEDS